MTSEIFEQYKKLVYYCYKKLDKTKFVEDYREDLLQEGYLALIRAVNSYTEYRGVKLSSYIIHYIKYTMYRYIYYNSKPYSCAMDDITDSEYEHLTCIEDHYEDLEEFVSTLLHDYKYYIEHYKTKGAKVDTWLTRAEIIIDQYIKNGKVTTREIEEEFCINRTVVSNCLKDLRNVITLKRQNKLYK